jgi:hypothetical protein
MSTKDNIIKELKQTIKYKKDSRESILGQLALKDAKIDKIDELIINIDRKIPSLIDEINTRSTEAQAAYLSRISSGCRSDLKWEITETGINQADDSTYTIYTCVKNDALKEQKNYYGQKYYRKPLNRDFGSNIISELTGNIVGGGITIAVTSDEGIDGIELGDLVTDNLDSPSVFSQGFIPKVIGFGTANVIGFTTSLGGSIGVGSDHFVNVGIGTTLAAEVGSAVSFTGILPEGTTVIGFGTANAVVPFYDATSQTNTNITVTCPSLILSNVAVASTVNGTLYLGTSGVKPTLILDQTGNGDAFGQSFTVIRSTKDIDSDFDYLKSPIDPVTIGILGTQLGIGHKTEIINNGAPPGPVQWKEQSDDPEPAVGAGAAVYYVGNTSWPTVSGPAAGVAFGVATYAFEGQVLVSTSSTLAGPQSTATVTSISPTGVVDGVGSCLVIDNTIAASETTLTNTINSNIDEINRLNDLSSVLREIRDEDELEAYSLLTGSAFETSEMNRINNQISTLDGSDLSEFEP